VGYTTLVCLHKRVITCFISFVLSSSIFKRRDPSKCNPNSIVHCLDIFYRFIPVIFSSIILVGLTNVQLPISFNVSIPYNFISLGTTLENRPRFSSCSFSRYGIYEHNVLSIFVLAKGHSDFACNGSLVLSYEKRTKSY
jgi:hypothetical protein